MNPILNLLEHIRERPEMYLGGTSLDREQQLRDLEHLLFGYQLALRDHGVEPGSDFLRDFAAFLRERHGCSAAAGPIAALLDMSADGDGAWALLWSTLREYRVHPARGQSTPNHIE